MLTVLWVISESCQEGECGFKSSLIKMLSSRRPGYTLAPVTCNMKLDDGAQVEKAACRQEARTGPCTSPQRGRARHPNVARVSSPPALRCLCQFCAGVPPLFACLP